MEVYIVNREDINEFLQEMEALGYTWSSQSKPTKFNPFIHGIASAIDIAIHINDSLELSWGKHIDVRTMQVYKPKTPPKIPKCLRRL